MTLLSGLKPADFAPFLGGADYGEIFLEASEGLSIRFEDSRVENIGVVSERGMGLRYLRCREGSIETLQGSAQTLEASEAKRLREGLFDIEPHSDPVQPSALTAYRHPVRLAPEYIPLEEKISLLHLIDRTIRGEFPHIRQVSLNYGERRRDLALLNSERANIREEKTAVLLSISVVAESNGILQTGSEILGGLKGYEFLADGDPMRVARQAAQRALHKLSAPKARAGEMAIVISSSAGGTFIHEAIGQSLEADHVQEGSSPAYRGRLGQTVAPETITVIDDPTIPFARGTFHFDDEGVKARPTPLVKNGILCDYLHDRVTALREGKPPNGHGRRESFHCRPIPRMSNLYIAPGQDDPRDILKSLKSGILVTRMGGGQVNTVTGEFVFEVDEGYWVEEGSVRHMVRDANLLGVGPEILRSIDAVGWDIGWGIGTCGKDGQGVPVSDAQPTIRIPRILIGGKYA
jgi:TldD protein